ncbi:MAG: hypothetical protein ACRD3J_20420, partial [Thermoanaerobaculia bacterium]
RHCPSCIDRSRVNKACGWTSDSAFPIDWNNPAHRQHLVADAQLAEDLAIRHGDAEFNRLYGVEGHGGLIDGGRVVKGCMTQLVTAIESNHAVTPGQIAVARGQRSLLFDTAAAASFLPLFALSAIAMCSRLSRRFSNEERSVRLAAVALTSVIASFLGIQAGRLWGAGWEAVRVGNGHMSPFRSAIYTRWTSYHSSVICAVLALTFCIVATRWQSSAFRKVTAGATMFTGTMLVAMFADVFVRHTIGYIAIGAALILFRGVVWRVERLAIGQPEPDIGLLLIRSSAGAPP